VGIDRQALLRQAEQSLRQGRVDDAIAAYVRLAEDQPRDWNVINALGDLYLRVGDIDRAVAQFTRVADFLFDEGFIAKAAALYKKALKIKGTDQHTLLRLAEIAARQGLAAESKRYLQQLTGAPAAVPPPAAETAPEPRQQNTEVLLAQAQLEMASGDEPLARATLTRLLAVAPDRYPAVVVIADDLLASDRIEAAYGCIEVAVDAALLESAFERAATLLQNFLEQHRYPPALQKLVDVCTEAGYDDRRRLAEAELALLQEFAEHAPNDPNAPNAPNEVDLTALLDADTGPRDLEQVFEDLRARADGATDEEAAALSRATAALHEGRIAEAIADLQAAARTPRLRFEASAQLARVYLQQANLTAAVDWFERAAEAPAPSPDEATAVLYALADTLERMGESARALAVFMEIDADGGAVRDVRERIDRLTRALAGSARA
jgi:tetratricopeptide (TPR) repeat protein